MSNKARDLLAALIATAPDPTGFDKTLPGYRKAWTDAINFVAESRRRRTSRLPVNEDGPVGDGEREEYLNDRWASRRYSD